MKIVRGFTLLSVLVTASVYVYADETSFAEKAGSSARKLIGGFKDGFTKEGENRAGVVIELTDNEKLQSLKINNSRESDFLEVGLSNGITCYIISDKPIRGRLVTKAYDKKGVELGRSEQIITLEENIGQDIIFSFPRSMQVALVDKYVVDYQDADITIDISPKINEELGLRLTKMNAPSDGKLVLYGIATKEVNRKLVAKAYDKDGKEISRDSTHVLIKANNASNINFYLSDDRKIKRYLVGLEEGGSIPVEYASSIKSKGLEITRVSEQVDYNKQLRLIAYVVSSNSFAGNLVAKALDNKGIEIGRDTAILTLSNEGGAEVQFNFPQGMNFDAVAKVVMEVKSN